MVTSHKESHHCLKTMNRLHTKMVSMVIKFIKGANFGTNQIKLTYTNANTQ